MDRKRKLVFLVGNDRGNAVIEFALLLPILLLLVFGITEFGRAWMTVNVLNTATREGARLAVVTGPDEAEVIDRVNDVCNAAAITTTSVTVSAVDPVDRRVTVSATTDFQVIPPNGIFSFFGASSFGGTIPLAASTTMRHEAF